MQKSQEVEIGEGHSTAASIVTQPNADLDVFNRATRLSGPSRSLLRPRSRTVPFPNGFASALVTPSGTIPDRRTWPSFLLLNDQRRRIGLITNRSNLFLLTCQPQIQRQAETLAQDPPRPLNALFLNLASAPHSTLKIHPQARLGSPALFLLARFSPPANSSTKTRRNEDPMFSLTLSAAMHMPFGRPLHE